MTSGNNGRHLNSRRRLTPRKLQHTDNSTLSIALNGSNLVVFSHTQWESEKGWYYMYYSNWFECRRQIANAARTRSNRKNPLGIAAIMIQRILWGHTLNQSFHKHKTICRVVIGYIFGGSTYLSHCVDCAVWDEEDLRPKSIIRTEIWSVGKCLRFRIAKLFEKVNWSVKYELFINTAKVILGLHEW